MSYDHSKNIIVKHLAGSRAYGTNIATSDTDYRGIFIPDKQFILTPFYTVNEFTDPNEEDTKYYELSTYLKLCLDANPNIIESLWVDENDITFKNEMYDHLRSHNYDFLSKKVAFTYTGYAHNQFTRMDNHHSWIDKERSGIQQLEKLIEQYPCLQIKEWICDTFPDYIYNQLDMSNCDELVRSWFDFDLFLRSTELQMLSLQPIKQRNFIKLVHNYQLTKVLDNTFNITHYNNNHEMYHYGENIYAIVERNGAKLLNDDGSIHKVDHESLTLDEVKQQPKMIVKFNKDEYLRASDNRKNYHTWKKNRNEVRAEMEKSFGYDGKHALHTVRLLRTAEEILRDGVVNVKRQDAQELLAIRNGEWAYDDLVKYYQSKSKEIREVLYNSSSLPKAPNIKVASQVLQDLFEMQWYGTKK